MSNNDDDFVHTPDATTTTTTTTGATTAGAAGSAPRAGEDSTAASQLAADRHWGDEQSDDQNQSARRGWDAADAANYAANHAEAYEPVQSVEDALNATGRGDDEHFASDFRSGWDCFQRGEYEDGTAIADDEDEDGWA